MSHKKNVDYQSYIDNIWLNGYSDEASSIRKELLELTQQTSSKAISDTDNTIAKFLNGEIELTTDEIETLKTDFYDKWIKQKELTPKQKKQLETYSLKEYSELPDSEYDEHVEQLLRDSVARKKNLQPYMNITEDGKEALGRQWGQDEIFKFTNGTSETRARMFLSEGKGFTSLESPAYVPSEKYLSRTGLQIAPYGTKIGERSAEYARMQSARFKDRPVIIEGEIPAQYVYRNTHGSAEFGIPNQYYNKIFSAKILDAYTGVELYHLENGQLIKSDTFVDAQLPDLKIKESESTKKLTAQEAFEKYGTNDDRFYTSQGLDPKQQKAAVEKLNAQRKLVDNTPIETKEFQQKLKDLGITEEEYYQRLRQELLSSESSKKPYKQLKAIRGPRLKKKINESPPVDIPKIQTQQDIVDEVVKKTKSNMVVKPVSNAGQESIEKVAKSIPSGGAGKYVALALGALAVTSAISNSNKKKEGPIQTRRSFNEKTRMTYDVPINDPQAMQMAQAMSQYRYGTRLPGFN